MPDDIVDAEQLKAIESLDAAKQDAEAQYKIGLAYCGNGVARDKAMAMAIKWFRKAAKNGHAEAQFYLGTMYYWGKGVRQDSAKACKWITKSAEQGNTEARDYLRKVDINESPVTFSSLVRKALKRVQKRKKRKRNSSEKSDFTATPPSLQKVPRNRDGGIFPCS